jgi:hypothetical protein
MNQVTLGYVILFVNDVAASLAFYEQAFGLACRFFNDDNGKAYGELETGAACLAFASRDLAQAQLKRLRRGPWRTRSSSAPCTGP